MSATTNLFHYRKAFTLESGQILPEFSLQYTTAGRLREDHSNVVWVCHALTGNADATTWWSGLFGPGGAFDLKDYFVICANVLGGCYGSTGPLSVSNQTAAPWFHHFPTLTVRDAVKAFDVLRNELQITKVHTLIGGSLGGQQVLEWALQKPEVFERIIPVACNAFHSPWGVAFNESQRMAIELDPTWSEHSERAGLNGMKVARSIAMISYRTYGIYDRTQSEPTTDLPSVFRSASYQQHQGKKLADRFNALSYHRLTKMMDSHNIGRGRSSVSDALAAIKAKTLIVGIDQDILFPVAEQHFLQQHIPNSVYGEIKSPYGHDSFLVEFDQLNKIIHSFLSL